MSHLPGDQAWNLTRTSFLVQHGSPNPRHNPRFPHSTQFNRLRTVKFMRKVGCYVVLIFDCAESCTQYCTGRPIRYQHFPYQPSHQHWTQGTYVKQVAMFFGGLRRVVCFRWEVYSVRSAILDVWEWSGSGCAGSLEVVGLSYGSHKM